MVVMPLGHATPPQARAAVRSTRATSTQLPPLPLRLLFCQVIMVSTQLPPLPLWLLLRHVEAEWPDLIMSKHLSYRDSSLTCSRINAVESLVLSAAERRWSKMRLPCSVSAGFSR